MSANAVPFIRRWRCTVMWGVVTQPCWQILTTTTPLFFLKIASTSTIFPVEQRVVVPPCLYQRLLQLRPSIGEGGAYQHYSSSCARTNQNSGMRTKGFAFDMREVLWAIHELHKFKLITSNANHLYQYKCKKMQRMQSNIHFTHQTVSWSFR